jgi:hypothetical protein
VGDERGDLQAILVALPAVLCGLGGVREPDRANPFGTLPLERFFSCLRGIWHGNSHYLNMMEMLGHALLMTAIRCLWDEARTSRRGRGIRCVETSFSAPCPRLARALPASAEDRRMGHVLSLALTAMGQSLVHMPDAFLESRDGLGGAGSAPRA